MKVKIKSLLLLLVVLVWTDSIFSQTTSPANNQDSNQINSEELKFLKEEIKQYRDFIQQERNEHQNFIENFYSKILTSLQFFGGILLFFVSFLGLTSIWQIKKSVTRLFEKYSVQLISKENRLIQLSIDEIKGVIERETKYLTKQILFLCSPTDIIKLETRELPLIFNRGIKRDNLKIITEYESLSNAVLNNQVNLILYYYNPNEQEKDPILKKLIEFLKIEKKQIPLIIYNFEKPGVNGQLFGEDSKIMRSYIYHLAANFPITLVNHLYTTINYLSI